MSTELATQSQKPVVAMLAKYSGQIEAVLPRHLTPTRVLKMIVGALNKTPALLDCNPMSVINAVLTASQLGLEIGPGQAYLIPFGKECTLLIDYRGKIDLAQRGGKVLDIDLEVVYSKDKFRLYRDETGRKRIEHEPVLFKEGLDGEHLPITEKDRGVPIGAYALAVMKGTDPKIVFMPAIDIDAIKKRSRAKDNGPWKTDEMEMWKKTVCHRICKTLPSSAEKAGEVDGLKLSQTVDDRFEMGEALDRVIDIEAADDPLQIEAPSTPPAATATQSAQSDIARQLKERKTAQTATTQPAPAQTPAPVQATPAPTPTTTVSAPWKDEAGMNILMDDELKRVGETAMLAAAALLGIKPGTLDPKGEVTLKFYMALKALPKFVAEAKPVNEASQPKTGDMF